MNSAACAPHLINVRDTIPLKLVCSEVRIIEVEPRRKLHRFACGDEQLRGVHKADCPVGVVEGGHRHLEREERRVSAGKDRLQRNLLPHDRSPAFVALPERRELVYRERINRDPHHRRLPLRVRHCCDRACPCRSAAPLDHKGRRPCPQRLPDLYPHELLFVLRGTVNKDNLSSNST